MWEIRGKVRQYGPSGMVRLDNDTSVSKSKWKYWGGEVGIGWGQFVMV